MQAGAACVALRVDCAPKPRKLQWVAIALLTAFIVGVVSVGLMPAARECRAKGGMHTFRVVRACEFRHRKENGPAWGPAD